MYTWNSIIHVRKINVEVQYSFCTSTLQFNSVQYINQWGTLKMIVQAKELQNFSLISKRLLNISRWKRCSFKLRLLVVSGPDSCTGQSVRPVGLPVVCRGAPHVSDHASTRTQRMLRKNSHPCSWQYRLHHAGIVVTNQNQWDCPSNIRLCVQYKTVCPIYWCCLHV